MPNPHNEVAQPTYNAEVQHFQISPLDLNGIHIISRRVSQKIYFVDINEWQYVEKEDSNEKTKESWFALDEDQTSELEIGKVPSCLPSDPLCVQDNNNKKDKELNFMEEEDIQDDPNQQVEQGHHNYIEIWFQAVTNLQQ